MGKMAKSYNLKENLLISKSKIVSPTKNSFTAIDEVNEPIYFKQTPLRKNVSNLKSSKT